MRQELVANKGADSQQVSFPANALPCFRDQDVGQFRRICIWLVAFDLLEDWKRAHTVRAPMNHLESHTPETQVKRAPVPSELMCPTVEGAIEEDCIDCCVLAGRSRVVMGAQDPIEIRR